MTRYEMVTKYNFYVRKRECYAAKIQENAELRATLCDRLSNCNAYMKDLEQYSDDAVIFQQLYDKNYEYFSVEENERLLDIIDEVGTHLEEVRQGAQSSINHWDSEIRAYDAEQARKVAED